MNVLITGAAGMVGSHLIDYLLNKGKYKIFSFIRWNEDLSNINHILSNKKLCQQIEFCYGDLRDEQSIRAAIRKCKPVYTFHLGAQSFPKTSFYNIRETYDSNIIGTDNLIRNLLELAPECIVHNCSSSEVFGRVPKDKLPIDEECSFHPASPYAISKIGTDLIGRYYSEAYNFNVQTTRMFTHTGPRRGDVFAESTFAKQLALILANKTEPIIKVGNLDSLRTWADVRDAVNAYYMLVTINPIPGSYYNIGGNTVKSIKEMLNYLIEIAGLTDKVEIKIDKERLRPIDADLQIPDTTKFEKHTGWKPKYTFEETMRDLLNYWIDKIKHVNVLDR